MFGKMHSGMVYCIPLLLKYDVLQHFLSFYYKPIYSSLFFRAVDHPWNGDLFATAGAQVDIWDHNRFISELILNFP